MTWQSNYVRRRRMMRIQKKKCYYCNRRMTMVLNKPNTVTIDHRRPISKNGRNSGKNIVGACNECNNRKANYLEADFISMERETPDALAAQRDSR